MCLMFKSPYLSNLSHSKTWIVISLFISVKHHPNPNKYTKTQNLSTGNITIYKEDLLNIRTFLLKFTHYSWITK